MPWSSQAQIAQLVIIEGPNDGLFVYNGTPAAGNLIASIAAASGTDQFGNAYQAGITTYVSGTLADFVNIQNDALALGHVGDSGGPAQITENPAGTLTAIPGRLGITDTPVWLEWLSVQASPKGVAQLVIAAAAATPTPLTAALTEIQGSAAADSLWIPSGDIPVAVAPTGVENWHTLTALGYQNSWADAGAGQVLGKYRLVASPPRTVELIGALTVGTVANGTLIATLPANYRPATNQIISNMRVTSATLPTDPGNMRLPVHSDGTISCQALAGLTSGADTIYFHDFISLDA